MQLKRISLSKVLKLELPQLINEVIRIVEKHDPDHLQLRKALNRLKDHQQQMRLLEVLPVANPLIEKVQQLREKELRYAGAIISHLYFIVRADIDSMRSAASVAMPVVNRFFSGLRKNNEEVINEIIHQFLEHLKEHPNVYDSFSNLGLRPFVDEMRKVNAQKVEAIKSRDGHKLKGRRKGNSRNIQKEAQTELYWMFSVIESLNTYEIKPNYDPLIDEMNVLLARYATIINTRKTHNKNKYNNTKVEDAEQSVKTNDSDEESLID